MAAASAEELLSPALEGQLSVRELGRAERARRDLGLFIEDAWHVSEPATPYVRGWHLDAICEHLEAVTRGDIKNLLINVPPRHMKSLAVSVFWPMWEWLSHPERRWLYASYAQDLAIRDSVKARRLVLSSWYQARWGHLFGLAEDQNQKTRFENDRTGYRLATSVGGQVTGEGGDRLVADDPHNVREAQSDLDREAVLTWWDESMSTRGNDPRTASRVIVMQRVHEADLSGHVLERGGYHHLCLPARYEPRVQVQLGRRKEAEPQPHDDCPVYSDPRTKDGELLWPQRYGEAELAELVLDLKAYGEAGQLQQRPVPREGALFHSEGFRPLPPDFTRKRTMLRYAAYFDLAFSERDSADYTVGLFGGMDDAGICYLLGLWRQRVQELNLPAELATIIGTWRPAMVGIEEGAYKQKATRDLIAQTLEYLGQQRHAIAVHGVAVTKDKVFRAQLPATRAKAGMIYADRTAPWWPAFEAELLRFPRGVHDDQVDALSGLVQLLIEHRDGEGMGKLLGPHPMVQHYGIPTDQPSRLDPLGVR